jgi:hypothetical protein
LLTERLTGKALLCEDLVQNARGRVGTRETRKVECEVKVGWVVVGEPTTDARDRLVIVAVSKKRVWPFAPPFVAARLTSPRSIHFVLVFRMHAGET